MSYQAPIFPDPLSAARWLVDELERLKREIERSLVYTYGTHTFDDIVLMVMQGRVRLWTTPGSFMLVEQVAYPQQVHHHIFLAGGVLEELVSLHEPVIAVAREAGACRLTITGRRGWVKALETWGWREAHTTVGLEI
jgi:hypothetical protein